MNNPCNMPIDAYHDGELSPARRQEVRAHLEHCPACAKRLAELNALSAVMKAAPRPGLSQIAAARLRQGMAARIQQNRLERDRMRIVWRMGAAAACIALAGSVWLTQASNRVEAAPPWMEVAAANDTDPAVEQAGSPVAQWYLASAWKPEASDGGH